VAGRALTQNVRTTMKKPEPKKMSKKLENKLISHLNKDEKKESKGAFIPLSRRLQLKNCG